MSKRTESFERVSFFLEHKCPESDEHAGVDLAPWSRGGALRPPTAARCSAATATSRRATAEPDRRHHELKRSPARRGFFIAATDRRRPPARGRWFAAGWRLRCEASRGPTESRTNLRSAPIGADCRGPPLTPLRSGAALQGAKPTTTRGVAIRLCPQGLEILRATRPERRKTCKHS